MPPETAALTLPEGSAREQLEDYLDALLVGDLDYVPASKAHILHLADCHAAQVLELCQRPYPVPGERRRGEGR